MRILSLAGAVLLLTSTPALFAADPPAPPAAAAPATTIKNVTPDEAEKLLKEKKDVVVLDVRSAAEFEGGHVPGAQNLDFYSKDFKEKLAALDKSKSYVVHCAAGSRSAKTCTYLEQLPFGTVYHMNGGFKAWEAAGKPVAK